MSIASYLSEQPYFSGLNEHQREQLQACAGERAFTEGEYLLRQGDEADAFYLIIKGRVEIKTPATEVAMAPIETLGAGDSLGWSWFIPPYRWHFDAVAREAVWAIRMDAKCLRELMESDYQVGYNILSELVRVMAHRIESSRLRIVDIYGHARAE